MRCRLASAGGRGPRPSRTPVLPVPLERHAVPWRLVVAGKNVPVVLLPRFSTFVGPTPCWSAPIPVSPYVSVAFDFWNAAMNGAPAAGVQVDVQESNDLLERQGNTWDTCAGGSPWVRGPGPGQAPLSAVLTKAWMRIGVTPLGTQPGVTCHAEGFFERRELGAGR